MNYATCFPFFWVRQVIDAVYCRANKMFFFCRVTSPGHQGYLGATIVSNSLSDWQALGIELCLTFVITLVYLV